MPDTQTHSAPVQLASGADVLDLAGRQRMLNQRLCKETLGALLGHGSKPEATIELLRNTAAALSRGGTAVLVPGKVPVLIRLPPPTCHEIRGAAARQVALLGEVQHGIEQLQQSYRRDNGVVDKLATLMECCDRFHATANETCRRIAATLSEEKRSIEAQLIDTVRQMGGHATELVVAGEEVLGASSRVSHATAEATAQTEIVGENVQQLDENVGALVSASEEMRAAIHEIATSAARSAAVAQDAATASNEAQKSMVELSSYSTEIASVMKLISDIASQTKLLALNATIEAVRAGDYGRGFAVVASEVKELAKRTSDATLKVESVIGALQKSTASAARRIDETTAAIDQVAEFTTTIASAVEEQSATTGEIARNVSDVALCSKHIASAAEDLRETNTEASKQAQISGRSAEMSATLTQNLRALTEALQGGAARAA